MVEHRDRAAGWQHAKRSGHENEAILEELMLRDQDVRQSFLSRVGKPSETIVNIEIGGLHEKNVPCVFSGETTKSKSDMYVTLSDGSHYNISIKKSLGGQVYLIGATRFINGFEIQYNKTIPERIKKAIYLFWGYSDDVSGIVDSIGTKKPYETRKHRLVADTLKIYDETLYCDLLQWFKDNMYDIANFCFSKGLASAVLTLLTAPSMSTQLTIYMGILEYFGYDADLKIQTARSMIGIRIGTCIIPIVFLIVGLIPLIFFPLNKQKEEELSCFSAERRHAENKAASETELASESLHTADD